MSSHIVFLGRFRRSRTQKDHVTVQEAKTEQSANIGQVKVTVVKGDLSNQKVRVIFKGLFILSSLHNILNR
jgi:hypothetical protein